MNRREQLCVPLQLLGGHLGQGRLLAGIFLGRFQPLRLLLVLCGHRDAGVARGQDRAVSGAVASVGEPGEPLVQMRPESDALGRWRIELDRAQAGDVVIARAAGAITGAATARRELNGARSRAC
jgi:hypothetical protein